MKVFSQICYHYRTDYTQSSQTKASLLLYWRQGGNPIANKGGKKKESRNRGRCIHKKINVLDILKKIAVHGQIYYGMSE